MVASGAIVTVLSTNETQVCLKTFLFPQKCKNWNGLSRKRTEDTLAMKSLLLWTLRIGQLFENRTK